MIEKAAQAERDDKMKYQLLMKDLRESLQNDKKIREKATSVMDEER